MLHKKASTHFVLFSGIFVLTFFFLVFFQISNAVYFEPKQEYYHLYLVSYDGKFSDTSMSEDLQSALYFLNLSDENVSAKITEYDNWGSKNETMLIVDPHTNQFIKTEGKSEILLTSEDTGKTSLIKFSKWLSFKLFFKKNFFEEFFARPEYQEPNEEESEDPKEPELIYDEEG